MKLLEGKTALITGASRGIGKAVALAFAKQGANIAFTDLRYDENAQATEKEIEALGVKVKGYASNAADFNCRYCRRDCKRIRPDRYFSEQRRYY